MPEIEIKLDLADETPGLVLSSDLLGEPQAVLERTSTYFDTPDRRLIQGGYSLRIRKTGASHVQTVKATGLAKSLFSRSEWETPVEGAEPSSISQTRSKANWGKEHSPTGWPSRREDLTTRASTSIPSSTLVTVPCCGSQRASPPLHSVL